MESLGLLLQMNWKHLKISLKKQESKILLRFNYLIEKFSISFFFIKKEFAIYEFFLFILILCIKIYPTRITSRMPGTSSINRSLIPLEKSSVAIIHPAQAPLKAT